MLSNTSPNTQKTPPSPIKLYEEIDTNHDYECIGFQNQEDDFEFSNCGAYGVPTREQAVMSSREENENERNMDEDEGNMEENEGNMEENEGNGKGQRE